MLELGMDNPLLNRFPLKYDQQTLIFLTKENNNSEAIRKGANVSYKEKVETEEEFD